MESMTDSSTNTKHQVTGLEDTTFNILVALGKEAQFLYSTIDNYIADAKKANRSNLVNMWESIKLDRIKHLQMLREALKGSKTGKVNKVNLVDCYKDLPYFTFFIDAIN